jgi:hypothetical protein
LREILAPLSTEENASLLMALETHARSSELKELTGNLRQELFGIQGLEAPE